VDTGSREENASKEIWSFGSDSNQNRSSSRRRDARARLKAGPLHLAAIVLAHFACMSLIVWLSL